jgi:hypothetical protein
MGKKKIRLVLSRQEGVSLIRTYYQIQKHRVAMGNQVIAVLSEKIREILDDPDYKLPIGLDSFLKWRDEEMPRVRTQLEVYWQALYDTEKAIAKDLKSSIEDAPIWTNFLAGVKGIGPVLAANIIYHVDISRSAHVSSLWKYAGLGITDGAADRLKRGEKANWNPDLKRAAFLMGQSFIKCSSPYREFFDKRRLYEHARNLKLEEKKRLTDGHIAKRCTRYMVKQFLSDLYVHWRTLEGLPVSEPWITEREPGHDLRPPLQ